jgi:hypothetical protein
VTVTLVWGRGKEYNLTNILYMIIYNSQLPFSDISPYLLLEMAYRVVRQRREARRIAKLEDIFHVTFHF